MKKAVFVLMGALLVSGSVMASGWYSNFKISQIHYSRGANGAHIVYQGGEGVVNPDGCMRSDSFIIPYSSSVPEREKAMLAGASMAFTSNKTVRAFVSGCQSGIGGQTYPVVWYLFVEQ